MRIGDLLDAVAQLVDQQHADRNFAFELVARLDADRRGAAGAPFAVGIVVAGAGIVVERHHVGGRDQLVLDRRIDALQDRQRHVARQIDGGRRAVEHEAGLRHVHVELFDHRPAAVRRLGDGRLDIGGKQRQEFFLHRVLVRPVLEADQHAAGVDGVAAPLVAKGDDAGLELRHIGEPRRAGVFDTEILRCGRRGKSKQAEKHDRVPRCH